MCVRTNVHFCMKIMLAYSPKTNFFFVFHGIKKLKYTIILCFSSCICKWWMEEITICLFWLFSCLLFRSVHSICLSLLFKTHSLVDYECTWLRLFQKRIGYTKSKKSLKIPKGQSESYIEEEQTTQWGRKRYKRTNNDLQNIHIKLKIE
jgi:hypothetical protein